MSRGETSFFLARGAASPARNFPCKLPKTGLTKTADKVFFLLQQKLRLEEKSSGNFSVASQQTRRKIPRRAAKFGFKNLRAKAKAAFCSQRHTNARCKKKTLSAVFAPGAILHQQEKNLVLPLRRTLPPLQQKSLYDLIQRLRVFNVFLKGTDQITRQ